jgi:hypothetical protein
MQTVKRKVLALVVAFGVVGTAGAAPPVIGTGDTMGVIDGYDDVKHVVVIGTQSLGLMPTAVVSLEQQLAQLGLAPTQRFGARFNVVPSADGRLLIESIYVVPPKKP